MKIYVGQNKQKQVSRYSASQGENKLKWILKYATDEGRMAAGRNRRRTGRHRKEEEIREKKRGLKSMKS